MKKIFSAITLAALSLIIFTGCYEPSPLYGKWADNMGNQITFISDGTFVAKIKNSTDTTVTYQGDYTVIDNVLIFSEDNGTTINTEWDIRGSMLYLNWTGSDSVTLSLTLYHVSK